jgi:hypothetical protein
MVTLTSATTPVLGTTIPDETGGVRTSGIGFGVLVE